MQTETMTRQMFPVTLGEAVFCAYSYRLERGLLYAQNNSIDGAVYVTNRGRQAAELVLKGCLGAHQAPAAWVAQLETWLESGQRLTFDLRGLHIVGAQLCGYQVQEEVGQGICPVELKFFIQQQVDRAQSTAQQGQA